MPTWTALTLQDAISMNMEGILFFHDHAMITLVLITIMTLYLVLSLMVSKSFNKFIMEGQEIETIWTMLPALVLVFIAVPSLKTLYLMEDSKSPHLTVKITGHQWYWSYEHSSLNKTEEDNFMATSNTLRLLKTSETLMLPVNTSIRALVASADVIHSWALPSMGLKVDALPGRLNQIFMFSKRLGLFTGQCSEICGMNHSFMPIMAHVTTQNTFIKKMTTN